MSATSPLTRYLARIAAILDDGPGSDFDWSQARDCAGELDVAETTRAMRAHIAGRCAVEEVA